MIRNIERNLGRIARRLINDTYPYSLHKRVSKQEVEEARMAAREAEVMQRGFSPKDADPRLKKVGKGNLQEIKVDKSLPGIFKENIRVKSTNGEAQFRAVGDIAEVYQDAGAQVILVSGFKLDLQGQGIGWIDKLDGYADTPEALSKTSTRLIQVLEARAKAVDTHEINERDLGAVVIIVPNSDIIGLKALGVIEGDVVDTTYSCGNEIVTDLHSRLVHLSSIGPSVNMFTVGVETSEEDHDGNSEFRFGLKLMRLSGERIPDDFYAARDKVRGLGIFPTEGGPILVKADRDRFMVFPKDDRPYSIQYASEPTVRYHRPPRPMIVDSIGGDGVDDHSGSN